MADESDGDDTGKKGKKGKKGGKKKLLLIIVPVLVLGLGGGGFMMMKGGKAKEPTDPKTAKAEAALLAKAQLGEIVKLEPITLNLAGGEHFLKVGLALQTTKTASLEEIEGHSAQALDAAIKLFGSKTKEELSSTKEREVVRKELVKELDELFEHQVVGVYFTDFVMQ